MWQLMGHLVARYVHSLAPLTLLTCYAALCFASLANSIHGLAHSLHSLPGGTVRILNMCSHCYRVSREQNRFWRSLETRPYPLTFRSPFAVVKERFLRRLRICRRFLVFICFFFQLISRNSNFKSFVSFLFEDFVWQRTPSFV